MGWEYKIVEASLRTPDKTAAMLTALGQEGWELVTVNPLWMAKSFFVMKRPRSTHGDREPAASTPLG